MGAVVNIQVKLVHNFKPTLAFVTIVDPQYDGQGVLCQSGDTGKVG